MVSAPLQLPVIFMLTLCTSCKYCKLWQFQPKMCLNQFFLPSFQVKLVDLVIGDIKSFGWWYGKIVSLEKKTSSPGLTWVYWFGDHKILEVWLIKFKQMLTIKFFLQYYIRMVLVYKIYLIIYLILLCLVKKFIRRIWEEIRRKSIFWALTTNFE